MRVLAIALTAVLIVVSVAAIVGGFAVLARRLLGLRFGLVRLVVAGLIGFAVAGPIARALIEPTAGGTATPLWFVVLAGAAALVVAMVFLVVAEALAPSGSLPGPLELRRLLRGRVARARRYSQISRILVRRGLGPYVRGRRRAELQTPEGRERLAGSVRQALEDAGVTFVKLGQVLSTRPDLLPPGRGLGGPGPRGPAAFGGRGGGQGAAARDPGGARLPHRGRQHGRVAAAADGTVKIPAPPAPVRAGGCWSWSGWTGRR